MLCYHCLIFLKIESLGSMVGIMNDCVKETPVTGGEKNKITFKEIVKREKI